MTETEELLKKALKEFEQLREKYNRFSERIRGLKARKCLDTTDVQRDHRTKQANQQAIDEIKQATTKIEKKHKWNLDIFSI